MAWTSPKTWAADELLTASDLNQYVRDNQSALYALTQGGGRKNLLHNGAMQIHQRGTSVTGITAPGGVPQTADRWAFALVSMGTWTHSVENDAPTGSGWRKSLKVLCSAEQATPGSPGAADNVQVIQAIEGQNLQSVLKGTTSAQQLTLSFWTKSNKTGTYVVELYDSDNNRHCAKTYTIVSSATWEQQSVTFPADLTGAFTNDNGASLYVYFHLAEGSDSTSGTLATTWAAYTPANRAVGQTNLAAATNNYWMTTGVQLEVGSAATGFEHKDYGTELLECQRYYYITSTESTSAGAMLGTISGFVIDTSNAYLWLRHPVTMRTNAAPTFTNCGIYTGSTIRTAGTMSAGYNHTDSGLIIYTETGALTTNWPCFLIRGASTAVGTVAYSADL